MHDVRWFTCPEFMEDARCVALHHFGLSIATTNLPIAWFEAPLCHDFISGLHHSRMFARPAACERSLYGPENTA